MIRVNLVLTTDVLVLKHPGLFHRNSSGRVSGALLYTLIR